MRSCHVTPNRSVDAAKESLLVCKRDDVIVAQAPGLRRREWSRRLPRTSNNSQASVETSLDAARTSARATADTVFPNVFTTAQDKLKVRGRRDFRQSLRRASDAASAHLYPAVQTRSLHRTGSTFCKRGAASSRAAAHQGGRGPLSVAHGTACNHAARSLSFQ